MNRQLLIAFSLVAALACAPVKSANAAGNGHSPNGGGHGHSGGGRGFGRGFGGGFGFGFGGGFDDGCDSAELYRQLYNNLPYFALHPPVYYSEPVPRTYGYSPFAYPPGVMTPEIVGQPQPVTINNPYVPAAKPGAAPVDSKTDRAAQTERNIEPLVVINPYVTQPSAVAQNEQ